MFFSLFSLADAAVDEFCFLAFRFHCANITEIEKLKVEKQKKQLVAVTVAVTVVVFDDKADKNDLKQNKNMLIKYWLIFIYKE